MKNKSILALEKEMEELKKRIQIQDALILSLVQRLPVNQMTQPYAQPQVYPYPPYPTLPGTTGPGLQGQYPQSFCSAEHIDGIVSINRLTDQSTCQA